VLEQARAQMAAVIPEAVQTRCHATLFPLRGAGCLHHQPLVEWQALEPVLKQVAAQEKVPVLAQ
jgi:hypothetical protein